RDQARRTLKEISFRSMGSPIADPKKEALRTRFSADALGARSSEARIRDSESFKPWGSLPNSPREAAPIPCSSPRKVTRLRYASRILFLDQLFSIPRAWRNCFHF